MIKKISNKEIQKISLDILKIIADICEKENLRYFLIYGTLIGAVRHKGYIPWDDDVDIMMPRDDYEVLLEYLYKHVKEYSHLRVFNPDTCPQYPYMISRISDDRYKIVMENEQEYGMGVFIDIYPFDGLGNTMKEAYKFGMKGDRMSSLCYLATRKKCMTENTTSLFRKIIKYPAFIFAKVIGKDYWQRKLSELQNLKEYEKNKYVGCVVWLSGGKKDIFKREWFDEYIMAEYEGCYFRIPKKYDVILKHIYGDYMKLPPEKERIGHHFYDVYKK